MKQPFKKKSYSFPSVDAMGFCVFYHRETKKCTVHPVKPETCRAGPVTFDINRRTKKVEWFLKTRAICEFAAKLHQNDEQFAEHFKIAREEILRLICKLDSEDLRAILSIEEPQTFKIGEDALPQKVVDKFG